MKVLLTGATGFLGSHLARALLADGHQIIAVKRSTSDLWRLNDIAEEIEFYDLDGLDLNAPFEQHRQIDVVVHTATCYGKEGETATDVFDANTAFPLRLLQTATFFNTYTFINTDTFFNTDTIVSKYLNHYALSKKQFVDWGKMLCESCHTCFVNLRLEHMYGPGDHPQKFTTWIATQCLSDVPEIPLTLGDQYRDFIHIEDVVDAYRLLVEKCRDMRQGFLQAGLGSGQAVTLRHFCSLMHKISRSKSILQFGALPHRPSEIMHTCADISTLSAMGWAPRVKLEDGVRRMLVAEERRFSENSGRLS